MSGGPCHCCTRQLRLISLGLEYRGRPICVDCAPNAFARFNMSNNDVSETEAEALQVGGERAGAFLDSIGKTDLATLSADEWKAFLAHVLCGYAEEIQRLTTLTPPF